MNIKLLLVVERIFLAYHGLDFPLAGHQAGVSLSLARRPLQGVGVPD